jgi:hypothetical protein
MKRIHFLVSLLLVSFLSCCTSGTLVRIIYKTPGSKISPLAFEEIKTKPSFTFIYPDTTGNLFLRKLKMENNLIPLIAKASSDKDRALILLNWTHDQWLHNGSNAPSKPDALTILKEAKLGRQFRCVEYGTVSASALLAVGMKARRLGLQARDVETCKNGGGHVLAEVWLADLQKWALIDGQFNIMPVLNGIPLNAVEFQKAIVSKQAFVLVNSLGEISKKDRKKYLHFVPPYLFYFTCNYDQRQVASDSIYRTTGKPSVMLVPLKAKEPTVFQRRYPNDSFDYTRSLNDFYQKPE